MSRLESKFADLLVRHHEADLGCGDVRKRDAVVVKMVALTALAFGLPPTDDGQLDVDDVMARLKIALSVLAES